MLNPHQLQLLRTVAATASYSRAAERLGISQPAVSMQVKKLEESVGVPLVVSRGRLVQLTEAGEALTAYADRILRLNEEALAAMADFREKRRGRVRVAASSTPGAYLLPRAVAAFRREHPGVVISMEVSNTRSALQLVAQGMADLAVVGEVSPDEADDFRLEPLTEDSLVVVVAPDHPWAGVAAIPARILAAEPLILREEGSSTRAVLDQRLAAATGRRAAVALQLGSTEAVKEAVAAGLGAAVLSQLAVAHDIAAGRMVTIPVAGIDLSRHLTLVGSQAGAQMPLAGEFAAFLRGWVAPAERRGMADPVQRKD
jgi:DNA-binding transcriptional LysR family regulator